MGVTDTQEEPMKHASLAGLYGAGLLAVLAFPIGSSSQAAITEEEAHAIGVDAYLYFYPIISFDITRLYSTGGSERTKRERLLRE
jgi:hypothetical protein